MKKPDPITGIAIAITDHFIRAVLPILASQRKLFIPCRHEADTEGEGPNKQNKTCFLPLLPLLRSQVSYPLTWKEMIREMRGHTETNRTAASAAVSGTVLCVAGRA